MTNEEEAEIRAIKNLRHTKIIWNDRRVWWYDGEFELSAKGNHDDFDFFPAVYDDGQALAGNPGSRVKYLEKIDDSRLKIVAMGGTYLLIDPIGNSSINDFRIEPYSPGE